MGRFGALVCWGVPGFGVKNIFRCWDVAFLRAAIGVVLPWFSG